MVESFRRFVVMILILLPGVILGAQTDPRGAVCGRVRSLASPEGIRGAALSIVVERGGRELVIGRAATDAAGWYRLETGPFCEEARLRVAADGFAPVEVLVKSLPNGDGLLVPETILDGGSPVRLSVDPVLAAEAPVWMHVHPLIPGASRIDLDAEPLVKARFAKDGTLILPNMAPGLYGFVVTDYFARFRPEVRVWRVGLDPVVLPPFLLRAGASQTVSAAVSKGEEVRGTVTFGSGAWNPVSGEEIQFRMGALAVADDQGRAVVKLTQMPPSICDVTLSSGPRSSQLRFIPGGPPVEVNWLSCASLGGQITAPIKAGDWANTIVLIGGRQARVGTHGEFELDRIEPGTHDIYIRSPGYPAMTGKRVVLAAGENRRDLTFTLPVGGRVDGETRGPELKRIGWVWVGFDERSDDRRRVGQRFQGMSDGEGNYSLEGVPAGEFNFYLRSPEGMYSELEKVSLDPGVTAVQNLRLLKAGSGSGELTDDDQAPIARARVLMAPVPVAPALALAEHAGARLGAARTLQTVTDDKGRYTLRGFSPGPHVIIYRAPGQPPTVTGPVTMSTGRNTSGFDWQMTKEPSTTLDVPPGFSFRLRSLGHQLIDRWLFRPEGAGPVHLSGLPPGQYRLDPIPAHVSDWRVLERDFAYTEWDRAGVHALVNVPSNEEAEVHEWPGLRLEEIALQVRVRGEFPDAETRVQLTAYPLASSQPLQPVRIDRSSDLAELKLELPRGLWLIEAISPGVGRALAGPISVGRGLEPENRGPVLLSLVADGSLIGFVDLDASEAEEGDGVTAFFEGPHDRLVEPWQLYRRTYAVAESGELRITDAPAGARVLRLSGPQAHIRMPVNVESFELLDLRRIVPGLPAALVPSVAPEVLERATLSKSLTTKLLAREEQVAPGTWLIDLPLPWEVSRRNGAASIRKTIDLAGGEVGLGVASRLPGRGAIRGSLRVDGVPLRHAALDIVPIVDDAYDARRILIHAQTDGDGLFSVTGVEGGEYALRLSYADEEGTAYRVALPLSLQERSMTFRQNVRLRTRALTVLAFDENNGPAGEDAVVRVLRTDLRGLGATTVFRKDIVEVARRLADETGEAVFRSLPIGTYDIEVSRAGRIQSVIRGIDLARGSGAATVRAVGRFGLDTVLELLDQDGEPAAGVTVFLFRDGAEVLGDRLLMSDETGRVYLNHLAEGSYRVGVRGPNHPSQNPGRIAVTKGRRSPVQLTVQRGAELGVYCLDEDGKQIPGVKIYVEPKDGNWQYFGRTATQDEEVVIDANHHGFIRLRNVPQGDCQIRAVHQGFQTFVGTAQIRSAKRNEFRMILKRRK